MKLGHIPVGTKVFFIRKTMSPQYFKVVVTGAYYHDGSLTQSSYFDYSIEAQEGETFPHIIGFVDDDELYTDEHAANAHSLDLQNRWKRRELCNLRVELANMTIELYKKIAEAEVQLEIIEEQRDMLK